MVSSNSVGITVGLRGMARKNAQAIRSHGFPETLRSDIYFLLSNLNLFFYLLNYSEAVAVQCKNLLESIPVLSAPKGCEESGFRP